MDKEKFEKDMAAFSFKQHQDALTYLSHLKITGWTVDDAKQWVKNIANENTYREVIKKLCPICSIPMRLLPVNINPETQTGDNSQSVWVCSSIDCRNVIYNEESVNDIIRKGGN